MSPHRRALRNSKTVTAAALALGCGSAALLLPACAPKSEPTMKEMPAAEQQQPGEQASASYDAEAIDGLIESLDQKARALPGRGDAAHRDAMRSVFDDLAQLLPILEGPEPSGVFRQQLRTLETARDRLGPEAVAAGVEPAIDTGLRASSAALARIARDEQYTDPDMTGLLEKLESKVDELDRVARVGRPYLAADASVLMAQVARQMADRLTGRATTAAAGTAEPTTAPAAPAEPPTEATPPQPPAEAAAEPAPAEAAAPPAEAPPEAPAEPPTEAPADAATETPAETPVEAPAETPAETPVEATAEPSAPAEQAPAEDAQPAPADDANK